MSDSVGKISLDLEVTSDLQGQINKVSNNIANALKVSLNASTGKVFENMKDETVVPYELPYQPQVSNNADLRFFHFFKSYIFILFCSIRV